MKTAFVWVITQRVMVISYRRFRTTYRSNLQGSGIQTKRPAGRPSQFGLYVQHSSEQSGPARWVPFPNAVYVSTPCWMFPSLTRTAFLTLFLAPSLHFTSVYFPFASPLPSFLPSFLFFCCLRIPSPASYSPPFLPHTGPLSALPPLVRHLFSPPSPSLFSTHTTFPLPSQFTYYSTYCSLF